MLRHLPNSLTFLRLLLAIPLGWLILHADYLSALTIGAIAGLSDALDGYLARRLGALSRFGAALDPIADKVLIAVTFVCLAKMHLIPWYLAVFVIARDLIIITGAVFYSKLFGSLELQATSLSKSNMLVQISFCVLVLLAQVSNEIPASALLVATVAVVFVTAASGFDYVMSWTIKALQSRKSTR